MVEICGFFWVFHRKKFVGRSIASYVFSQFRDRHNERDEALDIIGKMKAAAAGRPGAPPKPNVVACAIALARGEPFDSDAEALRQFNLARRTWVERTSCPPTPRRA